MEKSIPKTKKEKSSAQNLDSKTLQLIGKIFSIWNDPMIPKKNQYHLTGDMAIHFIHQLFTESDLEIWNEYIDLEMPQKQQFLKQTWKELKSLGNKPLESTLETIEKEVKE